MLEIVESAQKNYRMRNILLSLLLVITIHATAADIQVYFSPDGGCTEAVVRELGKAKSTVLVQA